MKKKIALLLAAIMTFAVIMPTNLMAASKNSVNTRIYGYDEDTLIPQIGVVTSSEWGADVLIDGFSTIANGPGSNLRIEMSDWAGAGEIHYIDIDLVNAEWAFLEDTIFTGGPGASYGSDMIQVEGDGTYSTKLINKGQFGGAAANWAALVSATSGTKFGANEKIPYEIYVDKDYLTHAYIAYSTGDGVEAGAYLNIPLVIKTGSDEPVSLRISGDTGGVSDQELAVSAVSKGTSATVAKVKDGTDEVALEPIFVNENAPGTIKDGTFKITAPKGYQFKTNKAQTKLRDIDDIDYDFTTPAGKISGGSINFGNNAKVELEVDKDGTVVNVILTNMKSAAGAKGSIKITGLVLQPIDDVDKYNVNLAIKIDDIKDKTKVTSQTLDVAKFIKAAINYSAKDSEDIKSGYRDQETAKITMEEQTVDSWWARRDTTFTLTDSKGDVLDGVKFTSADLETTNLKTAIKDELMNDEAHKGTKGEKTKTDRYYYNDDGNVLTLTSMSPTDETKKGKVVVTFKLSADINFEGDVYVAVGSTDIKYVGDNYIENGGIVKVATVNPTVAIDTKSTSIQIGAQRISTADITITEVNEDAMLERNKFIDLKVGQYGNGTDANIFIVPLKDSNISVTGDMKIKIESSTGLNGKSQLKIDRVSRDDLSTFTLSNVQVNVDRSIPYGTYELYVAGNALRNNSEYERSAAGASAADMRDFFDNEGIMVDKYITVDTPSVNTGFGTKVVVFNNESANVVINGEAGQMEAPTVNIDGSLYVPVRFIAYALGAKPEDIVWSDLSRTVSVNLNGRQIVWTEDSPYYVGANGVKVGMTNNATARILNDRLYISYRGFAEAFNIPITYDPATGAATYNPAVNK